MAKRSNVIKALEKLKPSLTNFVEIEVRKKSVRVRYCSSAGVDRESALEHARLIQKAMEVKIKLNLEKSRYCSTTNGNGTFRCFKAVFKF